MSFEDIKGQDSALDTLKGALKEDRVFSSYLFLGPEGVGKATTARNFAKALNCINGENVPCDACISCKKIDSSTHPDVIVVEPEGASHSIKIDKIRNIIASANLKAYEGKKKVFIIDKADSMTQEAANAFLKTLEEAPADSVFILVASSKDMILPTILSRCLVVNFFPTSMKLTEKMLKEKIGLDGEEANILSRFSSGRIGEAMRMKEHSLIDRKNRVIDSFLKNSFDVIDNYSSRGELKEDLDFLVSYFRDVFLYKTVNNEGLIFHADRIDDIKKASDKFTQEELDRIIKKIIKLRSYVDNNVNPKMIIDVLKNELKES